MECTAQDCSDLPPHSLYQTSEVNPLFRRNMLKPIPTWFHTIKTAMLQICSKLCQNTPKVSSIANTMQNNLVGPIPMNSFVLADRLSELIILRINWNQFILVLPKCLTSLQKSRMIFWHKMGKHLTDMKVICMLFSMKVLLCFLTFNNAIK